MLAVWVAMSAGVGMAREPEPPIHIPLEPMGYQSLVQDFLLAGSSMLTVDFVDKDHLLITFGVRRLMKREVDPPPDDDDRTVGAFLVELPSGKVLARTEWRMHDRLQYLWSLGHGRFLLRVRDHLTVIAPMQAVNRDDAFKEVPLLRIDRHIVAIFVSSDGDLLTIESTKPVENSGQPANGPAAASTPTETTPVQSNFYRLIFTGGPPEELRIVSAGAIRTRRAVALPMTTAGFLNVMEGGKGTYLFDFDEHAGKVHELLAFDTTCSPRATFVGHSEFVVFGCRGSEEKQDFAGFNLKGEEMWQQNFFEPYISPTFSFAPALGRFALGRTIVAGTFDPEIALPASAVTAQEVRVYQTYNGKQLFRIDCSPVERAGHNFALSADGLQLAVIRETTVEHKATKDFDAYVEHSAAVEVYPLPPPSSKDQAAVRDAQAAAPPDTGARIDTALARLAAPASSADAAKGASGSVGGAAVTDQNSVAPVPDTGQRGATGEATGTQSAAGAEAGGQAGSANAGDAAPDAPRKPPTLYGPDEKQGDKAPK
jgi:hypothetical protein